MATFKTKTSTISLILLLTISALVLSTQLTQPVKALDQSATYTFLAAPSPAGVGQNIPVVFWESTPTPDAAATLGSRFQGITVTITHPDGTTEVKGPYTLDAVASGFLYYTPTQVGKYTFQAKFPGQHITGSVTPIFGGPPTPFDTQFAASNSPIITVVVTQAASAPAPHDVPLPTNYWTRPINGQNANWWLVSSNWLMAAWSSTSRSFDQGNAYDPYTTAPNSAHIIWTKPMAFGGIVGGEFGGTSFYNGMSYEQFLKPPVIIGGRLYYNTITGQEGMSFFGPSTAPLGFNSITCVDMNTGATLFTIPNATLAFGQIYNFISPNQGGAFAYLWDTSSTPNWRMYDAWTGQLITSIANVPAGTIMLDNTYGGRGDVIVYTLSPTGALSLWNSSYLLDPPTKGVGSTFDNVWMWRPYDYVGQVLNGTSGTQWTTQLVQFPTGGSIQQIGTDNTIYVMAGTGSSGATFSLPYVETWAGYSMTDGHLMFGPTTIDLTTKLPPNASAYDGFSQPLVVASDGTFPVFVKETMQWYAWNVKTGAFEWGPTQAYTNGWGMYNYESDFVLNGILYNAGFDGMVHAFNVENGQLLWTFYTGDAGSITPYGTWPIYNGFTIADGKLFATTGDHGNGAQPLYQGEGLYVMDAAKGTSIWNLTGWFCQPAIADGIMVSQNLYDNQIYAFGRGPTATTITAPSIAIPLGNSLEITGTVTDQSPGAAKGAACVSEQDMEQWMEYLFEQQPLSGHPTGVPVTISVVEPNGNTQTIGTVTSDGANGLYHMMWTPTVSGEYTIVASFGGSTSYYGSYAQTAIGVSPSTQQASSTTPSTTMDIILAAVAIIIVIIVVAIVAIVLSRRRK